MNGALAGGVAVLVLVAGCSPTSVEEQTAEAVEGAFVDCMEARGITVTEVHVELLDRHHINRLSHEVRDSGPEVEDAISACEDQALDRFDVSRT